MEKHSQEEGQPWRKSESRRSETEKVRKEKMQVKPCVFPSQSPPLFGGGKRAKPVKKTSKSADKASKRVKSVSCRGANVSVLSFFLSYVHLVYHVYLGLARGKTARGGNLYLPPGVSTLYLGSQNNRTVVFSEFTQFETNWFAPRKEDTWCECVYIYNTCNIW